MNWNYTSDDPAMSEGAVIAAHCGLGWCGCGFAAANIKCEAYAEGNVGRCRLPSRHRACCRRTRSLLLYHRVRARALSLVSKVI